MSKKPFLRTLKRIWIGAGIVLTVLFIGYNLFAYRATDEAVAAMVSDAAVEVTEAPTSITFAPRGEERGKALLFFAGALVQPAAYAPFLRRLAESGYRSVLVPLPARSAPTDGHVREAIGRGFSIMEEWPSLGWVVGGHSKGGAIASQLAAEDRNALLSGILLVGTSHPREIDISRLSIPVLKVSGSRDGLASPEEVREYAGNLPATTRFVEIAGGNHAQFGYYGMQLGDRRAQIPRETQQAELLEAVTALLEEVAAVQHH